MKLPTSHKTPILLATTNPAKERTFRWLLDGLPLSPMTPAELAFEDVPQEEGETHEAIARSKAELWSLAGSTLAIASDGGLVLPALGGRWESRYTHRFAGPATDDAERLSRLLDAHAALPRRGSRGLLEGGRGHRPQGTNTGLMGAQGRHRYHRRQPG